jgi:hypothetical protein
MDDILYSKEDIDRILNWLKDENDAPDDEMTAAPPPGFGHLSMRSMAMLKPEEMVTKKDLFSRLDRIEDFMEMMESKMNQMNKQSRI